MTSVTCGSKLKSVGEAAFWNSGITSITLPSGVESIGLGAFAACSRCVVAVKSKEADIEDIAFRGVKLVKGPANSTAQKAARADSVKFTALG